MGHIFLQRPLKKSAECCRVIVGSVQLLTICYAAARWSSN